MADEEIDRLHIDITETGAKQAAASIDNLVKQLDSLETKLPNLTNQINNVNSSFGSINTNNAQRNINSVDKAMQKATEDAEKMSEAMKDASSDKQFNFSAQENANSGGGEKGLNLDAVSQLGRQLGLIDGKAESIANTAGKLTGELEGSAGAAEGTAGAASQIGLAIGAAVAVAKILFKVIKFILNETKKVAVFIGKVVKAGIDKLASSIKNKISKIVDPITKLFDRVMRVALNRFLRFAMRQITTAFSEGMQNVARGMESANKVLSVYSTRLMYLKNTLGASLVPLLQALTPLFLSVTNAIIKASNAVNQFLSLLNGKSTYIKAKEQYVDYAASLDKSSKKAKKSIDKLTASFDELHDITETATNTGDEEDYTQYFTTAGIEADIDGFYKKIIKGFEQGDLSEVGNILATKINSAINKIYDLVSWDKVGQKVTNYAKALASLVNTLVNNVNFERIGQTFAEGLNTILRAVNTFNNELINSGTFETLGRQIGTLLYTTITTIDWEELGQYFLNKVIRLFDFAKGFFKYMLEPVNEEGKLRVTEMVEKIFQGLSNALASNASKIESFGETIGDFLIVAFEAGAAIFGSSDFWIKLAESINKIVNKITEKKDQITDSLTKFVKAVVSMVAKFLEVADIGAIIDAISDIINKVLDDPDLQDDLQKIGEEFGEIAGKWFALKFETMIRTLPSIVWGVLKGTVKGIIPNAIRGTFGAILGDKTGNIVGDLYDDVIKAMGNRSHADGGFPEDGLFYANHNELVGQFSNGRTAVANNEQIVSGIEGGVQRGVVAAFSSINFGNNNSNEYSFYIDSKKMAKAVTREVFNEANRAGLKLRTAQ